MTISFGPGVDAGPLLRELLDAQLNEAKAVSFPTIERVAKALTSLAHEIQAIVWPVGGAAERVAGAATVIAGGALDVANWNSRLDGRRVLLFAVSGTSPLSLVLAAEQVRSMGAGEVHACGLDVVDADRLDAWESFTVLKPAQRPPRARSLVRAS